MRSLQCIWGLRRFCLRLRCAFDRSSRFQPGTTQYGKSLLLCKRWRNVSPMSMSGPGPTEHSRVSKRAQRVDGCSKQLVENYRLGSRTRFSVEWKTARATRDRCAGDAAFANSASTRHCQAPRSIELSRISLLHSRADLDFRPSPNRSPLPDFCLPSNLGNSFAAPKPTGFYTTDIRHRC